MNRSAFARLIDQRRHVGFRWGASDCFLWTADALHALTGYDFGAPYRGRYESEFGAARVMLRAGYRSIGAFIADTFQPAPRPRMGVLVLLPSPPLDALMIADGAAACWGQDDLGLIRTSIPPGASLWSLP